MSRPQLQHNLVTKWIKIIENRAQYSKDTILNPYGLCYHNTLLCFHCVNWWDLWGIRVNKSNKSRGKWRCNSFLSWTASLQTLRRALRNPASVGLFPAVKVPCANWDDEPGDPRPPSPLQDSPGFPRPLAAAFCPSMGLRWAVERGEEGEGEGGLWFPADHIRNGSLGFLHKFCSFSSSEQRHQGRAGGGGEEINSDTVY